MQIFLPIALALVVMAGAFLIVLGVLAFARPGLVRPFLLGFAASARRHYLELVTRLFVGTAFLVAAPAMAGSLAVEVAGWVLVGTTVIMFLVPWQAHRAFALRTVPRALARLPLLALASVVGGSAIIWSVYARSAA